MTIDPVLTHAVDWSVRAGVLLVPAVLFALLSRRSSAAVRHAACFVAVAVALAVPPLASLLPRVGLPLLPPAATGVASGTGPVSAGGVFLVGLWLGGAIVVAARVGLGIARAQMLCRLAKEVRDARVLSMAIRVRREIGLTRPLRVLSQRRLATPFTWGIRQAVVLLPKGADRWSRGRLRAVLLHELSHVKRRDCLTQLVADLACAVLWFHPLVWIAASRMRVERERACDDTIVTVGGRPSGYATLLLRMVKGIHRGALLPEPVATFGTGGGLTGRLRALLGPTRDRRALSPASIIAFALGALTLVLPVTAIELTRRPAEAAAPAVRAPGVDPAPGTAAFGSGRETRAREPLAPGSPRIAGGVESAGVTSDDVPAATFPPLRVIFDNGFRLEGRLRRPAPNGRVTYFATFTFALRVPGR